MTAKVSFDHDPQFCPRGPALVAMLEAEEAESIGTGTISNAHNHIQTQYDQVKTNQDTNEEVSSSTKTIPVENFINNWNFNKENRKSKGQCLLQ